MPPSHVVQELVIVFHIHPAPRAKCRKRIEQQQQMEFQGGDRCLNHDLPEVPDKDIDRVQIERVLGRHAEPIDRIEDGGQV